jgi:N-acylneuraminate cytidylyltransferase/CMP-N,N'-diacetyllegionaminic acid synthase
MDFRTLIIVPARSGSKGITDKNIRQLAGRPLLAWTAEAIVKADLQNSLAILSTDAAAYAEIGRQAGLTVPFLRPADCAGDDAGAQQVIEHALNWFQSEFDYFPELLMWLQPTSPFRTSSIIRQAVELLSARQADAVIGCKEIYRDLTSLFRCDDGFLSALNKVQPIQTARQQIKPLLTPNGAMYLCKTNYLLANESFYAEKTVPLIMNTLQSLDIDTEEDWTIAEAFIEQGLV